MDSTDSNITYVTHFCDLEGGGMCPGTTPYVLRKQDVRRVENDYHGELLKVTRDRIRRKFFGKGVIVKKIRSSGNGYRIRFFRYRNGYLVVCSFFHSKAIRVGDIKSYQIIGKDIYLDTLEHGLIHLETRGFMDPIVLKYLMREL